MTENDNGTKFVTWKALLATNVSTAGVVSTLLFAFVGAAWSSHSSQPHKGAVHQRELERLEHRSEGHIELMEKRLSRIEEKVDTLLQRGNQ